MIGLVQKDEIEEITLRPEIWWHDVLYHEVDYYMKWPNSADVRIFLSRPAEGEMNEMHLNMSLLNDVHLTGPQCLKMHLGTYFNIH